MISVKYRAKVEPVVVEEMYSNKELSNESKEHMLYSAPWWSRYEKVTSESEEYHTG